MDKITLITKPEGDYELLDSGLGEKLERYGNTVLSRPDPQALWNKGLSEEVWGRANSTYVRGEKGGNWKGGGDLSKGWQIRFGGLTFVVKPTSFKHTGLFPEQLPNWQWLSDVITSSGRPISVLNLFGYTGGATLAAASAGAEVCHVDASKVAVAWGRENAEASGLSEKPIRWIVDDVMDFVQKEIKRGRKYDVVVMDPPAFGHGPKDELWKIEEDLPKLLTLCMELMSGNPLCVVLNGYAEGYSPYTFANLLELYVEKFGGSVECGELAIQESSKGRLLPSGICARWKRA